MNTISPEGPIKLAVTVDDPFMWKGADFPPGYSPASVVESMTDAFAEHGVPEVYSFAGTMPTDDHPDWLSALDTWVERGHHVAAHTHSHSSLNWGDAQSYIEDIDHNIEILEPWLSQAPTRYFRYAFDMWGDEQAKTDEVQLHLARRGYLPAPITTWFYDVQFLVSYIRTLVTGDDEAKAWIRKTFASTAVDALRDQATAAGAVFGRDPVHIALIHGTPVAGDFYGDVLAAYAEHDVEFVTLEEAMADPANQIVAPTVTRFFRNSTQKWAEHVGVEIANTPPQILHQVRELCPVEGMDENSMLGPALVAAADNIGATFVPTDLDWSPKVEG